MNIHEATNAHEWDAFLTQQRFSPFLQSWAMGEVYGATGERPVRLEARENGVIVGICQAIVVKAKRGPHLAVLYGPVVTDAAAIAPLLQELQQIALREGCWFLRVSPFWPVESQNVAAMKATGRCLPSPLHLLGEHVWYLPLQKPNTWQTEAGQPRAAEEILMEMRKTTRNLVRRAEREGVTVTASTDPVKDVELFIQLHEETRRRHHFTPYTDAFFRAQVATFAPMNACTVYLARYQGEVIAASIHMHMGGETSYHHGASTHKYANVPASYLLQWTALQDALKRGDSIYSFWGIAPEGVKKHPFAGVTTFKRGFGGELLELVHCHDIPLRPQYYATRAFETLRKWKRGF